MFPGARESFCNKTNSNGETPREANSWEWGPINGSLRCLFRFLRLFSVGWLWFAIHPIHPSAAFAHQRFYNAGSRRGSVHAVDAIYSHGPE